MILSDHKVDNKSMWMILNDHRIDNWDVMWIILVNHCNDD
jgi:hypothetical protein